MKSDHIKYYAGYKYILADDATVQTKITGYDITTDYIQLTPDGLLTLRKGYAWDGCSGPTWDDKSNMRAGLFHDGGYQLIRLGLLPMDCKSIFDELLQTLIKTDSIILHDRKEISYFHYRLNIVRAWYYYEGVDHFASFACQPGYDPYPILTAP